MPFGIPVAFCVAKGLEPNRPSRGGSPQAEPRGKKALRKQCFFQSKPQAWYIIAARVRRISSRRRRVYHQPVGLDACGLMIYNSCGIDEIQFLAKLMISNGFAVDTMPLCERIPSALRRSSSPQKTLASLRFFGAFFSLEKACYPFRNTSIESISFLLNTTK